MKWFSFRSLVVSGVACAFVFGGYVGYLSALVQMDEDLFIQQVQALSDKERLERQRARAQSILDARSRAYLRRSQAFILRKQAEEDTEGEQELELTESLQIQTLEEADTALKTLRSEATFTAEDQRVVQSLEEEREDLDFFEDEVETLDQILAREFGDEEINLVLAGLKQRRRISDGLRQLLLLLDKRRELAQQREERKVSYDYWQSNPQEAPDGLEITVHNKGSVQRQLQSSHVTQISTAMSIMPQGFDNRIRSLYVVYGDPQMRRGMSGVGVVFMKGEEADFFRVLIHEFGHIFDLHREVQEGEKSQFYDGPFRLYTEDPSVTYYSLSWADTTQRVANDSSFASLYGTSDPFEDFAEAFALYVLQGNTFAEWQLEDPVLADKYAFLQDVFRGRSFQATKTYLARPYDVTMLQVDYEALLEL